MNSLSSQKPYNRNFSNFVSRSDTIYYERIKKPVCLKYIEVYKYSIYFSFILYLFYYYSIKFITINIHNYKTLLRICHISHTTVYFSILSIQVKYPNYEGQQSLFSNHLLKRFTLNYIIILHHLKRNGYVLIGLKIFIIRR